MPQVRRRQNQLPKEAEEEEEEELHNCYNSPIKSNKLPTLQLSRISKLTTPTLCPGASFSSSSRTTTTYCCSSSRTWAAGILENKQTRLTTTGTVAAWYDSDLVLRTLLVHAHTLEEFYTPVWMLDPNQKNPTRAGSSQRRRRRGGQQQQQQQQLWQGTAISLECEGATRFRHRVGELW